MAYPAAVVAALGLLAIALVVQLASFVAARRISRPVTEVRDALQAIASGDYTVQVSADRADEIGHVQQLLNAVAEELRRREAMKDLFGKYLSKQVAEQILNDESEAGLSGARREVSVLFADVRSFTSYAERHDPEQAALHTLNLKRAQREDAPIAIGIGVNTGDAISGNLGSLKRMEFTVIGTPSTSRHGSRAAPHKVRSSSARGLSSRSRTSSSTSRSARCRSRARPRRWRSGP